MRFILELFTWEWFPIIWFVVLLGAFYLGWQANNLRRWIRERRAIRRAVDRLS